MEKQIDIKYPSGHMIINLEMFFPTTLRDCKQVLKTIDLDWRHKEELIKTILDWMKEEQIQCNEDARIRANHYVNLKPQVREAKEKFLKLKAAVNVNKAWKKVCPVEYKELQEKTKHANSEYQNLKMLENSSLKAFNYLNKRKEKLQKNIEFFEKGVI